VQVVVRTIGQIKGYFDVDVECIWLCGGKFCHVRVFRGC